MSPFELFSVLFLMVPIIPTTKVYLVIMYLKLREVNSVYFGYQ